ncbi:MAG: HdeD family acid-resistance protein [Planctomycetota bacterium]
MRNSGDWSIAMGGLIAICGLAAWLAPVVGGASTEAIVGILLGAAGVVQVIHSQEIVAWPSRIALFFLGLLSLICGVLMIVRPLAGLGFVTALLAGYFVLNGIGAVALAMRLRRLTGWPWLFTAGVVTVMLAVLIVFQWPVAGRWAVGLLVGINLVLIGWGSVRIGISEVGQARRIEASPEATVRGARHFPSA